MAILTRLDLVRRRERWSLTWRGWFLLTALAGALGAGAILSVFPFLAVNQPIISQILVVEGWLPDDALEDLESEFRRGNYRLLVVTGAPIEKGEILAGYGTLAEATGEILRSNGFPAEKLVIVPSQEGVRDRTYHSALALRRWLRQSSRPVTALNVLTRGAHARRTQFLFQKALEGVADVGIIAAEDRRYDGRRWWRTSAGFRDVVGETIAYLYARFLFRPDPPGLEPSAQ